MLRLAPEQHVSGTVEHNAAVLGLTANWLSAPTRCLLSGERDEMTQLVSHQDPRAPVYEVTLCCGSMHPCCFVQALAVRALLDPHHDSDFVVGKIAFRQRAGQIVRPVSIS
jgi:hypothetical protein